ncbi:MAG: hypothetical protein Q9167_004875 [Letrouitia subvulpina]
MLADQTVPDDVVSVAENALHKRVSALLGCKRIDKYIALFSESLIQSHILSMIDLSNRTEDVSSNAVFNLVMATHLMSIFAEIVAKSVSFRHKVLRVTVKCALLEPLTRLLSSRSGETQKIKLDNGVDICPWTLSTSRRNLQKMICFMLLNAAIFSKQDEIDMDPSIASSLLEKYANLGDMLHDCVFQRPLRKKAEAALISLFENQNIPKEPKRIDWRAQLVEDLARDANFRYHSIVSRVSEVCQELELRCNNAERPLRDEQDRVHGLHTNLQNSIARIAKLENENQSYTSALEGLKYEKGKLEDQIKSLEAQLRCVQLEAQNVKDTLEDAVKRAEDVVETQATVIKEERLKHLAALLEKDEICEEQTSKFKGSESCLNELRQTIEHLRGQEKRNTAEIARLQERFVEQSDLVKQADMLVIEKEALILQYHNTQADLKEENMTLTVKVCKANLLVMSAGPTKTE